MENVKIIEIEEHGEITEFVLVDRGNNEFTSMKKSTWDEQQKAAELGGTL